MRAGTAVNNCATAGKDTASSLNAARAATDEMGCTCYWGMAEKEREGCSISPGTNFAANKGEEISAVLTSARYFCLAVWPSIFATCNRRDKNKLSLPVQYCHFGSIHLTTDVSTKKISVSQYCPNNTLQITSIQLIININHMAARSGSSR